MRFKDDLYVALSLCPHMLSEESGKLFYFFLFLMDVLFGECRLNMRSTCILGHAVHSSVSTLERFRKVLRTWSVPWRAADHHPERSYRSPCPVGGSAIPTACARGLRPGPHLRPWPAPRHGFILRCEEQTPGVGGAGGGVPLRALGGGRLPAGWVAPSAALPGGRGPGPGDILCRARHPAVGLLGGEPPLGGRAARGGRGRVG